MTFVSSGPALKQLATSHAWGPERYIQVVPAFQAGEPIMPPSTKVIPVSDIILPIFIVRCGAMAFASTYIPRKPADATSAASDSAACGGQTVTTIRHCRHNPGNVSASLSRNFMARSRVGPRRPCETQYTSQPLDRKSTRLNSSHGYISYAVFCLKK